MTKNGSVIRPPRIKAYKPTGNTKYDQAAWIMRILTGRTMTMRLIPKHCRKEVETVLPRNTEEDDVERISEKLRPFLISYQNLCETMGLHEKASPTISAPLGLVGQFCVANDLPALNLLVVSKKYYRPGSDDLITRPGKTYREEQMDAAFKVNWWSHGTPVPGTFRKVDEYMKNFY